MHASSVSGYPATDRLNIFFNYLSRWLLYSAIFFLPYTYYLVLNVGFPLKVYEVTLVAFAGVFVLQVLRSGVFPYVRVMQPLMLFLVITAISGLASMYKISEITLLPVWASGKNAPYISFILEFCYLVMDIFFMYIIILAILKAELFDIITSILVVTTTLVSVYGIYHLVSALLGVPMLVLPSVGVRRVIFPFILPRICASFKEPNYFAGYLICVLPLTAVKAFTARVGKKNIWKSMLLIQGVAFIFTFSTIGIIALIVSGGYFLIKMGRSSKKYVIILGFVSVSVILATFVFDSEIINVLIFEKLFSTDMTVYSFSRYDRLAQIWAAFQLFLQNPLLGVGLSHFALTGEHLLQYQSNFPMTANNIFVEVLCETGILGFSVFIFFFLKIFLLLKKAEKSVTTNSNEYIFLLGFKAILLSIILLFNAFPSHSLAFLWVMFGLMTGFSLHIIEKQDKGIV